METAKPDHSLASLVRELRDETSMLVRQEIALAKAETCEKAARLGRNAGYLGGGVALAYAALIVLLFGTRDLLAEALVKAGTSPHTSTGLASFIIAVFVGTVGWVLIAKAKKALASEGLAPKKTLASLREDQHLIKRKLART